MPPTVHYWLWFNAVVFQHLNLKYGHTSPFRWVGAALSYSISRPWMRPSQWYRYSCNLLLLSSMEAAAGCSLLFSESYIQPCLSETKLSHVSFSEMIIVHNCCCAVIDAQSRHKKLDKMASSGTFVTHEKRRHPVTHSQAVEKDTTEEWRLYYVILSQTWSQSLS